MAINQIFSNNFNRASLYVQNRYMIICLKAAKKEGNNYLYHNAIKGLKWAVANDSYATTYDKAVEELAFDENTAEDDVRNDYDSHYYVELIDEAIASLQSDCDYEKRFWK